MISFAELTLYRVVLQAMAHTERHDGRAESIDRWVDGLQAHGRYTFTRTEAAIAIHRSDLRLTKALGRLVRKRRIVSPRRGFYVIVPLEFSIPGAPPADWFIDRLMGFIGHRYYVGLLTAAAIHGAAHQQPQQFQVVAEVPLRPVSVGRVRITFVKKAGIAVCPTVQVNTSTGTMTVGTPEVTALDLVRYPAQAGGLDNVATVLAELAEQVEPSRFVEVIEETGVESSVVQRLGFLLDLVEQHDVASVLATWVGDRSPTVVSLRPNRPTSGARTDARWRLRVNDRVEPDL